MESTIHIRLNQFLREELEKISEENEIKLSNVVRTALEDYVNNYSKPTTSVW